MDFSVVSQFFKNAIQSPLTTLGSVLTFGAGVYNGDFSQFTWKTAITSVVGLLLFGSRIKK